MAAMALRPVKDLEITGRSTPHEIIRQMREMGGFTGRHLGEALDIMMAMVRDEGCTRFLSFPAAPVATGLRGVLRELVRRRLFHAIITTCGTVDHDLARSWRKYYEGSFHVDDRELERRGLHRIGNVFVRKEDYGPLVEEKMQRFLEEQYRRGVRSLSTAELWDRVGRELCGRDSILYWASVNKIPLITPAPLDGAAGHQLWMFWQRHKDFHLDLMRDQEVLSEMVLSAKRTGGLVIGGGVSKHHLLWWNQYHGGLDYAVYITTAVEYDGSLSGALTKEAVSWGKISPKGRHVTVHADATLVLPFLAAAFLHPE